MDKQELLKKVAPCSLMCHTCSAYEHGVICECAKELLKYLDGMSEFYEKHDSNNVEHFNIFQEELRKYGTGKCSGCRNREHHGCSIEGCFILDCTKKHKIDFCGECEEFPCTKTQKLFEKEVYLQWLKGNKEIKDLGIEEFWKNNSKRPHYRAYKTL